MNSGSSVLCLHNIPFSEEGAQLLFAFISQRYLRGSVIVTSNLVFAEWTEVFGDPRLTSALLDRLTHRCHILQFSGKSYRFRQSLQHRTEEQMEEQAVPPQQQGTHDTPPAKSQAHKTQNEGERRATTSQGGTSQEGQKRKGAA